MIDRTIRPAGELRIHSAILRVVGERGLGRRPIAEVTTADVAAMAHAAYRTTLPRVRPVERSTNGSVVEAIPAPPRPAAVKAPVRPPAPRSPAPAPTETPDPLTARQGALQALRADPTACAVLRLVADGMTNRQAATQLNVQPCTVKNRVSRWLDATGTTCRAQLATWANTGGVLAGLEAGR